jgi:hypothetical protein
VLHHVKDLSPEQRQAIESLLGHKVSEEETLSIKSIATSSIVKSNLSPEERADTLKRLDQYFAKVDAGRKPVSAEEEEAVINEALQSARPSYRPVR